MAADKRKRRVRHTTEEEQTKWQMPNADTVTTTITRRTTDRLYTCTYIYICMYVCMASRGYKNQTLEQ